MNVFPRVVLYADRFFPETVNRPHELRNSVAFRVIASFKGLNTELEIQRVKIGWRVSDAQRYVIDSSRNRAVRAFLEG